MIERLKEAEDQGAQYAVVCPPFYFKSSDDELIRFYETVASSSSLGIVLYNIPQLTGCFLGIDVVTKLLPIENITGLKDSSNDFIYFLNLLHTVKRIRPGFQIYQGNDNLVGPSILAGADGAVPGCANLIPELFVDLCNEAFQGKVTETRSLQALTSSWASVYGFGSSAIVGLKAAMYVQGLLPSPAVTAPFLQLDDEALKSLERLLAGLCAETSYRPHLPSKSPDGRTTVQ